MILRHFPRSYKISVDQRPPIGAKGLLSPAARPLHSSQKYRGDKSEASTVTTLYAQSKGTKAASSYLQMRILRLSLVLKN